MKPLFFILFVVFCSFAQFREGPGPVPEFTYDSTKYMLLKYSLNMSQESSMDALMMQQKIAFDRKNETAYVKSDYWKALPFAGKDMIATYMALMCGNANKNYRYPLTIKLWETKQTVGTFIVSQEDLGLRSKVEELMKEKSKPTYERVGLDPKDSLFYRRLQTEKRVVVFDNKILIKSDLWNAWDKQLQEDMLFLFAVVWGNEARDYSYNPEFNIIPDVKYLSREEKDKKKIDLITKSFSRPATINDFRDLRDNVGKRHWQYYKRDNVEELVQGEEDLVSFLIREDKLYINHSTKTAYIRYDVWYNYTENQKKVMTTLMAVKCGNDIRNSNYRITIKDMQDHSVTYASYNNSNFLLASR